MSSMATTGVERRRVPRAQLSVEVTLSRRRGGPIHGRTLDLGTGGMRIATRRPLAIDELLAFELPVISAAEPLGGQARVLREHAQSVYALRFEQLPDQAAVLLSGLVTRALGDDAVRSDRLSS